MTVRYFELFDDKSIAGRWHLRGPLAPDGREVDPRIFTRGTRVELAGPFRIPLRRKGRELDFTLADFSMPVLRSPFTDVLEEFAAPEIQRFPATVEGGSGRFDIVNAVHTVDCLDAERSSVSYWTEADGIPDLVGRLQTVVGLRIDPERAGGRHIFRLQGWEISLIVSERVKQALEGARGALFEPV